MSPRRTVLSEMSLSKLKRKGTRGLGATALLLLCAGVAATTGCGDGGGDADGTDTDGGTGGGNGSDLGTDLGTDLGSTGGSGSGLGGAGGACGGEEVTADPVVANVLFVIDKSSSMNATPNGFTESKWDTLVGSLSAALAAVEDDIQMGLKLYPSGDADVCTVESGVEVDIAAGAEALPDIDAALADAAPSGQTPTAAALELALEYFTAGPGAGLEGEGFVVLATDGGPNCGTNDSCVPEAGCQPNDDCGLSEAETCTINIEDCGGAGCPGDGSYCLEPTECLDDSATLNAVTALEEAGIKTIVVGMPGSESYQGVLDALAVAGGMPAQLTSPKYYKVDDADSLSQALEDITKGVIRSCDILAEEPPPDPTLVNVFIDGEVVPKDPDDGWQYGDSTNTFIQIVGSYCEDIESSGARSISVEYGCPTIVIVK